MLVMKYICKSIMKPKHQHVQARAAMTEVGISLWLLITQARRFLQVVRLVSVSDTTLFNHPWGFKEPNLLDSSYLPFSS